MVRIGLLSDTHAWWDEKYVQYFSECDEIWHTGDIGSVELADRLAEIKPLRAVVGNIDGHELRRMFPVNSRFTIEGADVWLTHIGGHPGKYAPEIIPELYSNPPKLFVCGHSHILRVKFDKKLNMLYINPGAAGKQGFHKQRTLIRFTIDQGDFKDLEVIELG
ncbi:MAG: metallophosphoesterase family protein [Bacteroidales bacterium]|nr:metallophosphoesterase family protein [Bacteroidales bacterium]